MNTFKTVIITTLAIAGISSTALADCTLTQKQFDNQIATGKLRAKHFSGVMRDMRQMRKTAKLLENYGKNDACEELVEAMQELSNAPPQKAGLRPVTDIGGSLRVDQLMDSEIRAKDGKVIGEVENVIINGKGVIEYVVVEFGGFLGIGEEQAAIPFKTLKVSPDRQSFFVGVTRKQFDSAPRFRRNAFDWAKDDNQRNRIDQYYAKPKSQ
ncbi:MAG: PRC-barrel domain-containing protein [Hyphomicrobiaceae bacterium]